MRGFLVAIAVAGAMFVASPMLGTTRLACSAHIAVTPYITSVDNNVVTLYGAASIGGCPLVTTTTADSVTLTVCLQHLEPTGWTDIACNGPVTKGWNRYWRYARTWLYCVLTRESGPGEEKSSRS